MRFAGQLLITQAVRPMCGLAALGLLQGCASCISTTRSAMAMILRCPWCSSTDIREHEYTTGECASCGEIADHACTSCIEWACLDCLFSDGFGDLGGSDVSDAASSVGSTFVPSDEGLADESCSSCASSRMSADLSVRDAAGQRADADGDIAASIHWNCDLLRMQQSLHSAVC